MTVAKRKLSDILGRKRSRQRISLEINERDDEGDYVIDVEVRTMRPTRAIRVSRAVAHLFGPFIGRLLVGGGLELLGTELRGPKLVKALADSPELWATVVTSAEEVLETIDDDELEELAVALLAGCTRFRVTRDPDTREPGKAPGDPGVPTEWVEIEEDELAREVINDLFPSVRQLYAALWASARLSIRPTSPAGRTNAE